MRGRTVEAGGDAPPLGEEGVHLGDRVSRILWAAVWGLGDDGLEQGLLDMLKRGVQVVGQLEKRARAVVQRLGDGVGERRQVIGQRGVGFGDDVVG